MTVDEFLARHSLHPLALVLLVRWSRTPEGQRFVAGAPLAPMDNGKRAKFNYVRVPEERKPRKFNKRRGRFDDGFDWGFDE